MKLPGNETWAIVSLLFMSIYRYTLCIRQILVRTARSLSAVAACCRCCFAFNWIDDRSREIVSRSSPSPSPTYNSINLPFTMCSHILERVYWTHLHFYKQVCFEILLLYLYFHVDAMREVSRLVSSCLPPTADNADSHSDSDSHFYLYSFCNSIRPSSALLCLSVSLLYRNALEIPLIYM